MKLDSSSDNINTGLLPASGNGVAGSDHAPADYTKAVGAVKLKYSNTVLKYGEMTVKNPVFMTSDSRLLPETAEGFYLVSKEVPGLTLEAGHFTSIRLRAQTNRASGPLTQADFAGGSYSVTPALTASVYASSIKDYWDKRYLGLTWIKPLDLKSAFTLDFNGYDQKSKGQALGGDLDLRAFSLKAGYRFGGHSAALAYQVIDGRGAYKYGADGSDTNYLVNYIQYMDATHAGEHSWQARYDYDFAAVGVPGLNFMTRYARGDNFKTSAGDGAKEWERNISLAYTIQAGPVKNLNFKIRQATYRSDINSQIDEVRVITEYPLSF
ncbi:Outer membrane porin [Pseudomonas syringae pv. aceris]|nr:Outer membrane porin [Pseudomonas syringae pv. aceris]